MAAASAGSREPVQFGEPDGAVGGFDVAEDAAGADRGQLLVVTDQPDTAAPADDEGDGGVEGDGVGHPGLVDDHQGVGADPGRPVRQRRRGRWTRRVWPGCRSARRSAPATAPRPRRTGPSPTRCPPLLVQAVARACMAVVLPVPAGAMASCSRAPEVAIRRTRSAWPGSRSIPLAVISNNATSTPPVGDGAAVGAAGGGDEPPLGGQHGGGGVQVGAGDAVDAGAVGPPQQVGFDHAVGRVGSGGSTAVPAPRR